MHHFRLANGVQVRQLGSHTLQVALDPIRQVRFPDNSHNRELLRRLARPGVEPIDPADSTLRMLSARRLVVSAGEFSDREHHRARTRVFASGLTLPEAWLAAARVSRADTVTTATVALLVGPQTHLAGSLTAAGLPHLVADFPGGTPRLGPFVIPGQTPCVDCIALQSHEFDPMATDLPDPDPDNHPAATALAVSFLFRDLLTWLDGGTPWTQARTILLGPNPEHSQSRTWLRHPECACTWI